MIAAQRLAALADRGSNTLSGDKGRDRLTPAVAGLLSPWFRHFLTFDPRPVLARVEAPVLALIGARDLQVPPADNLPALRKALQANRDVTIRELPELNHLLQEAQLGLPSEYGQIEQTISPTASQMIVDWISLKQRRR